MNNLLVILLSGLLGAGGLALGIVNMNAVGSLTQTVQEMALQNSEALPEFNFIETSEQVNQPTPTNPQAATVSVGTTQPSVSQQNQPSSNPAPAMSQSLATQLVTSTWQIPMTVQEGPSPTITYSPGGNGMYNIVVMRPLLDDSTSTYRYEGVAMKGGVNGEWILTPYTLTWKCHVNRGHQDFSTVPCN